MTTTSYESPLRRMISDSTNQKYKAIETLEEAREIDDSYLVMEGDDGGQIYLVVPVREVKCDELAIHRLLTDIDSKIWNDSSMSNVFYEVHSPGSKVAGGMGGGNADKELWVHQELYPIKDKIEAVITAQKASIDD